MNTEEKIEKEAKQIQNSIKITNNGSLNGIVVWQEIIYNNNFVIKCGILESDSKLDWSMKYKQGVYLLDENFNKNEIVNYLIDIDLKKGIFNCKFN